MGRFVRPHFFSCPFPKTSSKEMGHALADYLCENLGHLRTIGVDVWITHELPATDMRRLWRRAGPLILVAP